MRSVSVDVLAAQVRKAVSVSMMQTGERYVDRDGNPVALWTHDEYDEAMAALGVLVGYAKRAERMEIKPDPTPRLPELEIEDGYGI